MKKSFLFFTIFFLIGTLFFLGFTENNMASPNTYYKVYLDEEEIGVIASKQELESYIDKKGAAIKKKLHVNKVYAPTGLQIKKITTYNNKIDSVKYIYEKISKKKPFTVKGYQFTITKNKKKEKIYVLKKSIFKKAIENTISSFIGTDTYKAYKNNTQSQITSTGTKIEKIYVSNDITVKEINIPVSETIYQDEKKLSQFLLFGKKMKKVYYTVKADDTVESVAFNAQVSTEELLVSNPKLKSAKNLLYAGQSLVIAYLDPQINVIVESHVIKDIESIYRVEEKYDPNRIVGDDLVTQQGENGLERVTQNVKYENGVMVYVDLVSKEELKPTINQVVIKGNKMVPNVGTMTNWAWPTASGYTITSNYAYRIHPISGVRKLHPALDIAGTGHGSPIYASNNGVVTMAKRYSTYGNCIIINHNNGYYTLYGHLSRIGVKVGQVVSKGSRIGDMGMTGSATGPHLHYELWVGGAPWGGGTNINPWTVHR